MGRKLERQALVSSPASEVAMPKKGTDLSKEERNEKYGNARTKDEHVNPNHGHRGCTDCICMLIFVAYMLGSVYLAFISFSNGRLAKLYRGIDMYGNVCGMDLESQSGNKSVTNPRLDTRKKPLYYPFYAEFQHTGFFMTFGICVEECPYFPGRKMLFSSEKSQVPGKSGFEQYLANARTNTLWYEDPGETPPSSDLSKWAYSLMYGSNYNMNDTKIYYDYSNAKSAITSAIPFDFLGIQPIIAPRVLPENSTDYSAMDELFVNTGIAGLTPRAVGDWRYPCSQSAPDYAPEGNPPLSCRGFGQSWSCDSVRASARGESCIPDEDKCTPANQAQARRTCYGNFPLYDTVPYFKSYCFPNITKMANDPSMRSMYSAFKNATSGPAAALRRTMSDVVDSQAEIIWSCVICILLGFAWLRFIQCAAKCMVWCVLIGSVAMTLAMGYCIWSMGEGYKADGLAQSEYLPFTITGYVFLAFGILLLCFVVFKRQAIMVAIEIIEEASKAVRFLWVLPLYPIITCTFVVLFALYSFASVILLLACGELSFGETTGVRMISFDQTLEYMMWYQIFAFFWMNAFVVDFGKLVVAMAVAMWYFADNPQVLVDESGEFQGGKKAKKKKDAQVEQEAQGCFSKIYYCVFSCCCSPPAPRDIKEKTPRQLKWVYVDPADRPRCNKAEREQQIKEGLREDELVPEQGEPGTALPREPYATLQAVYVSARYHIGSIAFGSFILAVVHIIRAYLLYLETTATQYKDNRLIRALSCLIQCYLRCLEQCIEFINKNAYIQIGLFGKSFCASAYNGFTLVMRNIVMVATLDGITDALIFLGKIAITMASVLFCFIVLQPKVESGEIGSSYLQLIIVLCLAWFISGAFLATYDMATDTLMMCILEDKERFSGDDQRNYWCDELEALLDPDDPPDEVVQQA